MPREKFQTLTEQMFYILLCLRRECCGMDVMAQVEALTGGRVSVGPGTLYNLLEEFSRAELIRETKAEGRRRNYLLTEKGEALLEREYRRICLQAADYCRCMSGAWQMEKGESKNETGCPVLPGAVPVF